MKETTFEEQSGLRIYSLGIVIKQAPLDTTDGVIMVSPIESMNAQTPGVIANNKNEFRGNHPDEKGKTVKTTIKADNFVKAKWLAMGGGYQITAPEVFPNETVILYRYGNHDVFYWTTALHEPHLRKTEAAKFAFSSMSSEKGWDKDGKPIKYDEKSSYVLDVNGHKKVVKFTTPTNGNEPCLLTIEINAKSGSITLKNDKGDSVVISKGGVSIASTGEVRISAKKLKVECDTHIAGSLIVDAGGDFGGVVKAKKFITKGSAEDKQESEKKESWFAGVKMRLPDGSPAEAPPGTGGPGWYGKSGRYYPNSEGPGPNDEDRSWNPSVPGVPVPPDVILARERDRNGIAGNDPVDYSTGTKYPDTFNPSVPGLTPDFDITTIYHGPGTGPTFGQKSEAIQSGIDSLKDIKTTK